MTKRLPPLFIAILFLTALPVHADEPDREPGKHLELMLPQKTDWALVVVDIETGRELAGMGNSLEQQLVPASLMKLLVTGAVFDHMERGGSVRVMTTGTKVVRRGKRKVRRSVQRAVEIRDRERLCRVLRDMNVHSRNHTAQSLADFLGEKSFGPPRTRIKGAMAVCNFLNTFDLPAGEAVIADGCGLMRENRVTARFIARYLQQVAKKPWFGNFRDTLPRPGLEGTVKRIGYTDPRFRVKTGRLNDVFALAGYGIDAKGRNFSFAFIVNAKKGRVADREHSRGEVMRLLAEGALQ